MLLTILEYNYRFKYYLIITLTFFFFSCSSGSNRSELVEFRGGTMGTTYVIKFVLNSDEKKQPSYLDGLKVEIDRLLRDFNGVFSTYDEESEISFVNGSLNREEGILISREFREGIIAALKFSDFTEGKFDPSISPLVDLWGFGRNRREVVPDEADIARSKKLVNYKKIKVENDKLYLAAEMQIDLSAIAKGKAVDLVGEALEREAIDDYLVEIGGEVRARGRNQRGKAWAIFIVSPDFDSQTGSLVVSLDDLSMATSGDYLSYFEKDGKRYSHIIDPVTGYPISHKLASISVLAENCEEADALATAILVMGEEEGKQFAKEKNIPAHFIYREEDRFSTFTTSYFKKRLKKKS